LPRDETTPPVTKINFTAIIELRSKLFNLFNKLLLSFSGPPIKSEDKLDRRIQFLSLDCPIKSGNDD